VVGEVKHGITTLKFAPLKPATIAHKDSSQPLVDTNQLRQSVTYQLEANGGQTSKVVG